MSEPINWDKLVGNKVKSTDGEEIGEIENTTPDSIEVKDGLIAKRHYYIPIYHIQGLDNSGNLVTNLKKEEIQKRFMADNPVADLWRTPKR